MSDQSNQGDEPLAPRPGFAIDPDRPSPAIGFPDGPRLRFLDYSDVSAALKEGWRDFLTAPQYGLFFGAFYAIGGMLLFAAVAIWDAPWAIIAPAIAFPLLGPFVAVGVYEVSRRLTSGEPLGWGPILGVVFKQTKRELSWMAFVMLFIFWIWAYQVRILLAIFLDDGSFVSLESFFQSVVTTQNGVAFLAVGSLIGVFLYTVLFSVTVIAMPLLTDRDYDVITALASSVAVVRRNPGPMLGWGALIALLTVLAMAPAFLGLLIVLPVLGHATWRLYTRAVAPVGEP